MTVNFKIAAIENQFNHLFDLDKEELHSIGGLKMIVDEEQGYPCRVSLEDASIGEEVILFPYQHHETTSPYQSSGPIFVRKNARLARLKPNEIPAMLLNRLLSLRVYNEEGIMIMASTISGVRLKNEIEVIFKNAAASYIHIHNSSPGCYNCQVNRMS